MGNTVSRIKEYIDSKSLSVKRFEESVGFSNGAFASQYKNNKTIGVDKVENILRTYPDLSPDWLLTGNGPMLRTGNPTSTPEPPATPEPPTPTIIYERDPNDAKFIASLEKTITAQEKTIASQEETIAQFKQLAAAKDEAITAQKEALAAKQELIERDRQLAAAERKSTLYGRGHVSDTESTALDFAR